jgi:hypothetical protein
MRDTPSSDELIRRAKEDFAPTVYSRSYRVVSRAEDIEAMVEETMRTGAMGQAMAESMAEEMDPDTMMASGNVPDVMVPQRPRRPQPRPVEHAPRVEHLQVSPSGFPSDSTAAPGSDDGSTGGGVLRALGLFIFLAIAGVWFLLLVGVAQDPGDAGDAIVGGILVTAIPLAIAFLLIRRARKLKQPTGLIT